MQLKCALYMHNAIAAVNIAALREEIYCCGGKRKKNENKHYS